MRHTLKFPSSIGTYLPQKRRDLTKDHLLTLCCLWNYRSDAWERKGNLKRRRLEGAAAAKPSVPSTALALPSPPVLPLPVLCVLETDSVRAFVDAHLRPLLRRSAAALEGRKLAAATAFASCGFVPFGPPSLENHLGMVQVLQACSARWGAAASSERRRAWIQPALALGDPSSALAWEVIFYCPPEDDAMAYLAEMSGILASGMRYMRMVTSAAAARQLNIPAGTAEEAVFKTSLDEFSDAMRDCSAFGAATQQLLAQLRVGTTLHTYSDACQVVLLAISAYAADASRAYTARHAWSAAALQRKEVETLIARDVKEFGWQKFLTKEGVPLPRCEYRG